MRPSTNGYYAFLTQNTQTPTAKLLIQTDREIADAISVPSQAIVPEMGRNIVYVYRNGKAQPVEINTGIRTEARVQAIEGLHVGDTLITSGVMQLRTGSSVSISQLN